MPKYILVEAYSYNMSNNVYDDYQPIRHYKVYDNFNVANHELYCQEKKFHKNFGECEYYQFQDDETYYSEKYDQIIYPPKLYTVTNF